MYKSENSDVGCKGILAEQFEKVKALGHAIIEARREGAYIYDPDGQKYIDCISSAGIFNLGRKPEKVAEALKTAVRKTDQGNFPMISIEKATLAKKLAEFTPGDLECTVYSVIRGESVDFACKLARGYTERKELVFVDGSCFGQTGFALSLSDHKGKGQYGRLIPEVTKMPFGDLDAAAKMITSKTAGVFIEPIQAENGCRKAETAYLKGLSDICKKNKALLIFDETQTGMGRCGAKFACEKMGIIPDILVIGEALGAGMFPIAATVFTRKLNTFLNAHPMIHLSTFGGSDIGCRTALAALNEYERLEPWENAETTGKSLRYGLSALMKENPGKIKSVQGEGLLIALTFHHESDSINFCREAALNGVIVTTGEISEKSVIFRPSLLISEKDVEDIIIASKQSLDAI